MSNLWNIGSKDILKAITAYPDYPIYFMIDSEDTLDPFECPYTIHTRHRVVIGEITKFDGFYFDDECDLRDYVECNVWDDSVFVGENERAIDRIIESQRWEPCILVYTGA